MNQITGVHADVAWKSAGKRINAVHAWAQRAHPTPLAGL
ncbi:hypothetical protein CAter282_2666 [Collimonas arenae]|uniref:Uncharacterized protein n=1 Tax=Collimonas arenae TaxID=279058 RepID=A0A127PRX8_9BURK|nr:hypothetical protein CAter10_2939 [Collimonas arenae]AMP10397.1 hypothetical protein CAter282_2666 [Collimonas arenae]